MATTQSKLRDTRQKTSSVCSECGGSGTICAWMSTDWSKEVYGDDREVQFAVNCPSCNGGLIRRAEEVRKRANIPSLYYDKKLEDFKWDIYQKDGKPVDLSKHKALIEDLIANYRDWKAESQGLYLYSSMRGTGKTLLASCICRELMDRYAIVTKFVQATSIIEESKKPQKTEYETPYIEILKKCELLVLDDIGINNTDWMNSLLFEILDYRYQNKLITIVTANISIVELSKTADDRIVDRLNSNTTPVHLPEYAVRQKEAYKKRNDFLKKRGLI